MFKWPENWKQKIKDEMTLESKIPPLPKGDELVKRPDGKVLREHLNRLENVISKKYNKMRDLNKELKEISISIEQKNKGVFK